MSLGKWSVTLPLCTKIIGDMLSNYSASREAQGQRQEKAQVMREGAQIMKSSRSAFASPQNPTIENSQMENVSRTQNKNLDRPCQEAPATGAFENTSLANDSPSKLSKSGDASLAPSEIVSWSPASDMAKSQRPVKYCKPSDRTWSILLKAFMDHNQPRAAEKVLNMMRRQDITPNMVTWNSLATGYARLQDIPNAVKSIERCEDEGWEADAFTISGLRHIRNREALWQALREKDLRREKRISSWVRKAEEKELYRRLEPGVDEVIGAAEHIYEQEEKDRFRASCISRRNRILALRRFQPKPKPIGFDEDEIVFPKDIPTAEPGHEGSISASS
jgi:pentatricopeptide repeat protein